MQQVGIPGFEATGVGALGKEAGVFRHPSYRSRMTDFVDRVHQLGGFLGTQLVMQGGMPSAPSATFSGLLDHRGVHVLNDLEVAWVINEYIESAVIAADCGVDSIELHANHDDMIEWFLSPLTNHRTDSYGGSPENRRRFLTQIVDGIRARVPRPLTIGLRLAMDQYMEGGYALDECVSIMKAFEVDGTVDYFNLDVGGNWGPITYLQHGAYPEAAWSEMCGTAKAEVVLPVLYVGRVVHASTAEAVIARGDADMVGMVRALIADSDWLRKTIAGRAEDVRPCIALNDCIHRYTMDSLAFGCGINPRAGSESQPERIAITSPKKLLVIGAGPAGMELAALAAERGHCVQLWESNAHIGGRFATAAKARCNAPYQDWIDWQGRRLSNLGVDLVLGKTADLGSIQGANADVIAIATGATLRKPGIPGEDLAHVMSGDEALLDPSRLGDRVVIIVEDDGPAPLTVADHLAGTSRKIVLAFQTPGPAPLVGKYSVGAMYARLDADGVEILTMARATRITPTEVHFTHAYSGRVFSLDNLDSVVLMTGGVGNDLLYRQVVDLHPRVHLLGDAFAPRRVTFATKQAYALALNIA